MPTFTRGHAVFVGVGEYQDSSWSVPLTAEDAQSLADAFQDPAVCGYLPEQITLLCNDTATRPRITAALSQLSEQAKADDTVVIFFCGHGVLNADGTYYFTTHDTVFAKNEVQPGTGLASTEIIAALRAIKAQKLLVIINACFSGHLSPTLGPPQILGAPPSATLGLEVLATGEGRALITASRPTQYSYFDWSEPCTFFGQALVDTLRSGESVGDSGYIGLFELYQQVYRSVTAKEGARQEPMLTLLQGVGPFPIALAHGGTLGASSSIQQYPPKDMAVELVAPAVVQALGRGAQGFNISGEHISTSQNTGLINMPGVKIKGNFTVRDMAGGNISNVNVDIKITAAAAAAATDKEQVITLIDNLHTEVAKLTDAPKGKQEDAADDLRKAREAGEEGDTERLLEKLESAQRILFSLGSTTPAALVLGQSIGVLLQRVMGLTW